MSDSREHPLEQILRAIHHAAPRAWYPQAEARREGYRIEGVEQILEMLYLEGLIIRGDTSPQEGPGVVLTARGEEVLRDPDSLARLHAGEPINPTDPGAIVRSSLHRDDPPTVTRFILYANLVVFAYCIYLASQQKGLLPPYLSSLGQQLPKDIGPKVYEPAGGVAPIDIIRGQWWRLATACFVHGFLLHLVMNMYGLYVLGRFVEQTWGGWRFAIIYAISGWSSSCLAMALTPGYLVGASGAICGILATAAVWVILYGKYLPRAMARRGRTQMAVNVVLIVFISLVPGVSAYGHLGGAVAGGLTALALHFLRFGPPPVRYLAVAGIVAIPLASTWYLDHARKTAKVWENMEARERARAAAQKEWDANADLRQFKEEWADRIRKVMTAAIDDFKEKVEDVQGMHFTRRDPDKVKAAIAVLDQHIASLDQLALDLEKSGPITHPDVVEAQRNAIALTRFSAEVFRDARRKLLNGEAWKNADDRAFGKKWDKLLELRSEWEKKGTR